MANIRYYAEWSTRAGREITEEQARALSRHVRAWQADDGAPERVEAYEQGRLVRVDYYAGSDAEHGRAYPGVLRAVHRVRANSRSFTWSAVQTIDGAGVVKQRALSLEKDGVELLNVQLDGRGLPTVMEKYYWDDPDTLHFVFEYRGTDGQYVAGAGPDRERERASRRARLLTGPGGGGSRVLRERNDLAAQAGRHDDASLARAGSGRGADRLDGGELDGGGAGGAALSDLDPAEPAPRIETSTWRWWSRSGSVTSTSRS